MSGENASGRLDLDALRDRAEYLTMHPTGPGWMQAPFDLLALLDEVERLRGFAQKVLDAGPEDFTDATLYEWLCDLHDEAAALLDDRTETR